MISSEDVREELAQIAHIRRCDRLAELSALFHAAGSLHLRGKGEWAIHLDLGSGAAARRAFALLRDEGLRSEIRTYQRRAFDRGTRYQLHLDGDDRALDVLASAGVLDGRHAPLERAPRRVVARACCRAGYLRGAFLGGGTLSIRRSAHLELRTATREAALVLQEVAADAGIGLGLVERPTHHAAYAKAWDDVESVLALTGAAEAVLALEERVVLAATREQANRMANADHANLVRTTKAARAQLEAVELLRVERRLEELPIELREAADLRLRHPAESLRELAQRTDPPASKAAMQRRLRRLEDIARG
ncbi:MAG: DNA-binding protein WhiA [Gaiellaceae bacterium]